MKIIYRNKPQIRKLYNYKHKIICEFAGNFLEPETNTILTRYYFPLILTGFNFSNTSTGKIFPSLSNRIGEMQVSRL